MADIMTEPATQTGVAPAAGATPGMDGAAATVADRMRVLLRDGRVNVAKLLVPALLRTSGGAAEARLLAAEVGLAAGDLVSAAREAAEALVMVPGETAAKAILGRALLALGRRDEAVSCLTEAWHEGARDEASLFALAEACPAAAIDPLFAALRGAPQSVKLYRAVVRALLDIDDASAAGKICDIAAAAGLDDPSIRLLALEVSGQSGDWQKALAVCEAIEAASPAADA